MRAFRQRFSLLMIMLIFFPYPAWSQSFDCHKAETETEWAICSTPELSKLDDRLASTYRQLAGPAAPSTGIAKKAEQMQTAWLHGRRDLCGGEVGCLMKAYQDVLGALAALPFNDDAAVMAKMEKASVVPRCKDPSDPMKASVTTAAFAKVACSDGQLMEKLGAIEAQARLLRPRLSAAWRAAFDLQQAAFPASASQCPSDKDALYSCVAKAVEQRSRDISDLAANLDKALPDCSADDLTLKEGGVGDAGMSQVFNTYLLEYHGRVMCRIRGYPAIRVYDASGKLLPDHAAYASQGYFSSNLGGGPLPVTLSPDNKSAWFGIHTATACDSPAGLSVDVALPLSTEKLGSLKLPTANCPVTVTPISMISTLLSTVK